MKHQFAWLCIAFILLLPAICQAEKGILVVQVSDIHNQPVEGMELSTKGSSESGITDRFGRTRIKLDPRTKANDWIALQIVRSPARKDLVLISPWDSSAQVPPFQNETVNVLHLVVANRGDRALLENGKALIAMAAQINRGAAPKPQHSDSQQERKEALDTTARLFGLTPEDIDKAIRTWGERSNDPYEKGLAALYQGNYPAASQNLSKSLEMREKKLAADQAAVADTAFFLCTAKLDEEKFSDAAAACRKAFKLRPQDGAVLNCLGLSLVYTGESHEGESLLLQSLDITIKEAGPEHPNTAIVLSNLGLVRQHQGKYSEAESLFRKALAIHEKKLGADDFHVGIDLDNLAVLLTEMGQYSAAEPLYQRALLITEKALGPNHPKLIVKLDNYAAFLEQKGDRNRAEALYYRAFTIAVRQPLPNDLEIARRLNNLAQMLRADHQLDAAELMFRRALSITEKVAGPDDLQTATCLNNLAGVLKDEGKTQGVEAMYLRALNVTEKSSGPESYETARVLNNLAEWYRLQKQYAAAKPLYLRAQSVGEKFRKKGDVAVCGYLSNLGLLLEAEHNFNDADYFFRRALAVCEEDVGPSHTLTQAIYEHLVTLKNRQSGSNRNE